MYMTGGFRGRTDRHLPFKAGTTEPVALKRNREKHVTFDDKING